MDIYEAIQNNNLAGIKKAVQLLPSYEGLDVEDEPFLFWAIGERIDLEALRFLVASGFATDVLTNEGMGVLDYCVAYGNIDTVRYAVEELGFDPDETQRRSGFTPLMQAACYGMEEVATYLVSKGAQIDSRDRSGATVIDYARKTGKKKIVTLLQGL